MKLFVTLSVALLLVPATALAQTQTLSYSWEDGGTILGSYGSNLVGEANVSGAQNGSQGSTTGPYTCPGANSGTYYLHVAEDPHTGTPQAFIAWITGLTDGDVVDASFFGYDITAGASPSLRIWGHYTDSSDPSSYLGSAGGNEEYTDGSGWDDVAWSWTFDSDLGARSGLTIEARLYSTPATMDPDHTDYWIDDCTVTAPDTATIHFAPEPTSLLLLGLGGAVLMRRKK